ncbi:hypothetical protein K3495_g10446 [Podosphaera aphanis]|nr:hypothetical protein K3495_g10446 [Podosphaera aphanis]
MEALMAPVKTESSWPSPYIKSSKQLPEKPNEKNIFASIIPLKANFQSLQLQQKRKFNTEEAETTDQFQPFSSSSLPPRNPFDASPMPKSQKKPNRTKLTFSSPQTT